MSRADDRADIAELLYEYGARLDAGDLEGSAALFAHATYRASPSPVVLRGADEVAAAMAFSVRRYDGSPRTHHNITNVTVTFLDDDTARARAYYTVIFHEPGAEPRVILTGRYLDSFERAEGTWRHTDRYATFDQVGDLALHLDLDVVTLDLDRPADPGWTAA